MPRWLQVIVRQRLLVFEPQSGQNAPMVGPSSCFKLSPRQCEGRSRFKTTGRALFHVIEQLDHELSEGSIISHFCCEALGSPTRVTAFFFGITPGATPYLPRLPYFFFFSFFFLCS